MSWKFSLVAGPFGGVAEGPAWDGSGLLFTHIPSSIIYRYDPGTGATSPFRRNSNCANGLMFDALGRLYACEGGARRVVRYDSDSPVALADGFGGNNLNIPNDLAIDQQGRVWFSDPFYTGAGGSWSEDRSSKELDHESVYRLDSLPDGKWQIERVTFDTTRPNGLLFSLDHKTLYVAQTGGEPEAATQHQLRSYPVNEDGSLGAGQVLHDFGQDRGIDGMVLDTDGHIVATAGWRDGGPGPSIYVFSSSGDVVERHALQFDQPTNCTFGGEDLTTLYVTTLQGHLLRADTDRKGRLHYPKAPGNLSCKC